MKKNLQELPDCHPELVSGFFLLKKNISEKITFINVNKNIDKVKGGGKINYFIKGVIKK